MSGADWIIAGEFFLAFFALVYFVIAYVASSRGRALRTAEGRHMLAFRGALVAWMAMGVVHSLVPAYPGQDVVRVTVIGAFVLAALQGDVLMTRAQLRRRRMARQAAAERSG